MKAHDPMDFGEASQQQGQGWLFLGAVLIFACLFLLGGFALMGGSYILEVGGRLVAVGFALYLLEVGIKAIGNIRRKKMKREKCGYDPEAEEKAAQAAKQARADTWRNITYGVVVGVLTLLGGLIFVSIFVR